MGKERDGEKEGWGGGNEEGGKEGKGRTKGEWREAVQAPQGAHVEEKPPYLGYKPQRTVDATTICGPPQDYLIQFMWGGPLLPLR